jgi:hypothetical protein
MTAMSWTSDPPDFAAYVDHISIVDRGDFAAVLVDMRCKRVPANGELDIEEPLTLTFFPRVSDANIVWPEDLGPYTAHDAPQITINLGRGDMRLQHFDQGRYSVTISLMREGLWSERVEIPRAAGLPVPFYLAPTED